MSLDNQPEIIQEKGNEQAVNAPNAPEASTPEAAVSPAVANFRKGFYTESRYGLLMALGEEPQEYQQVIESLLEDLRRRAGLETHLAVQIGETFWRMRRAQRMRDGLALRSIQSKVQGEEMVTSMQASKVFELLEPFQRLKEALARRGDGPTAEEIDAFVQSRKGEISEGMQEFIQLLNSLKEPLEEAERKATRQKVRKLFARLLDVYEGLAWQYSPRAEKVRSSENLAALMAPDDEKSGHLQSMEDLHLRWLWRLINAFERVRQGGLHWKKEKISQSKPLYG
jgi:hypothetical protein